MMCSPSMGLPEDILARMSWDFPDLRQDLNVGGRVSEEVTIFIFSCLDNAERRN
jgi:hypothetical protein